MYMTETKSILKNISTMSLLRLTFQVTDACNLSCTYCYEKNKANHFMKAEDAEKLIDRLFDCHSKYFNGYFLYGDIEGVLLDFIGGEPTLCMDLVSHITRYFCKQAAKYRPEWVETFKIAMQTNGTTYFTPQFQRYLHLYRNRIDVAISLDGDRKCHDACRKYKNGKGSYSDVERAVLDYLSRGKQPNTKLTVSPQNVKYFYDGVVNLHKLGYRSARASYVYENVWTERSEKQYFDQLIRVADFVVDNNFDLSIFDDEFYRFNSREICEGCGANGSILALDYTGKLYSCFRFSQCSIPHREAYCIGNVDDGVTRLDRVNCLRNAIMYKFDKCKKCEINDGCGWCAAYNYDVTGDITDSPYTWCSMHKLTYEGYKYFLEKKRKKNGENKI